MKTLQLPFSFIGLLLFLISCTKTYDKRTCNYDHSFIEKWIPQRHLDSVFFESSSGEQIYFVVDSIGVLSLDFETDHELCEGCQQELTSEGDFSNVWKYRMYYNQSVETAYFNFTMFNGEFYEGKELIHATELSIEDHEFQEVYYYHNTGVYHQFEYVVIEPYVGLSFFQLRNGLSYHRVRAHKQEDRSLLETREERCFTEEAKSIQL